MTIKIKNSFLELQGSFHKKDFEIDRISSINGKPIKEKSYIDNLCIDYLYNNLDRFNAEVQSVLESEDKFYRGCMRAIKTDIC